MTTTDTPRTDACPHCGDEPCAHPQGDPWKEYRCGTVLGYTPSDLCREREARQKAEAEVERLEKELSESHAQSHGLARRVIQAETMLEVVQRQLKNYTAAIETL